MLLASVVQHLWELRRGEQGAMWRTFRRRAAQPEHRLQALEARRAILEALRRRDSRAAKRAMQRLLHYVEQRLLGQPGGR
jgi:DNA-binding FadR family transcriptional regulator